MTNHRSFVCTLSAAAAALLIVGCSASAAPQQPGPRTPIAQSSQMEEAASASIETRLQDSLMEAPAPLAMPVPRGGRPCLTDIHVTLGGIVLTYGAQGKSDQSVRDAVRHMARAHNRRFTEMPALPSAATVPSTALVEHTGSGSRVTLVANDGLDMADLYEHLASDAPDLLPSGSIEQSFCTAAAGNTAASVR
jgi:hypothetical protein